MQLGMFMQPIHAPKGDLARNYENDRETIVLADQLGFHECWIGEHVSALVESITSPLMFCASIMDRAKRIKFGSGVFCLPQQHPAVIASQAAMFDQMTRGRFQMGIGPGGLSSDFELFELTDGAARGKMMLESIDMIHEMWAGTPPYDIRGEFWNISINDISRLHVGVGDFVKPYQKPYPPVAVSLMSPGSHTALVAGERGWIPISGSMLVQPRHVISHWDNYVEGADKEGRKADRNIWRVGRSIWVDETDEAAEQYVSRPGGVFNFYFDYVLNAFGGRNSLHLVRPQGREHDESVTWLDVAKSQIAWGAPGTVLDKLIALADELGGFGVLVMTAHEWDDVPRCRRSMELFVESVLPKLNQYMNAKYGIAMV